MPKRQRAIAAAAALWALPLTVNAVTITFQFDLNDILVASSTAGPFVPPSQFGNGASLSGNASTPILTLPPGADFEYGIDVEVTGNYGLGLVAFQTGITNSLQNASNNAVVQPSTTIVNSFFNTLTAVGKVDGLGGISANLGTAGSCFAGGTTNSAKSTFAANSFAELYNSQKVVQPSNYWSQYSLSATVLPLAMQYITKGVNASGSATYNNTTFNPAVDTISPMPVLYVNKGPITTTTTTTIPVSYGIVSLMSTAPTTYGSQVGSTLNLTYIGPGNYLPGYITFAATNRGYGVITGFHTSDTEVFAMDVLNSSGYALTPAQINAVISDINAGGFGVTASPVTGVYSTLFKNYDVLLNSTSPAVTGATSYLAFDFTPLYDNDPATRGFTVGAIAAIPEPPSTTLAVVGVVGFLLRRRTFPLV